MTETPNRGFMTSGGEMTSPGSEKFRGKTPKNSNKKERHRVGERFCFLFFSGGGGRGAPNAPERRKQPQGRPKARDSLRLPGEY